MLMVPFQCEWCWFVNIKGRDVQPGHYTDLNVLPYLRRFNLDMMWSKEKSTVQSNLLAYKSYCAILAVWQIEPENLARGPYAVEDTMGVRTAIAMLRKSQMPGKNVEDHKQFDSIRKLRTALFNINQSSALETSRGLNFQGDAGRIFKLNSAATQSSVFNLFCRGLEKRMGRMVKQDTPLSIQILKEILGNLETCLGNTSTTILEMRRATMLGAFLIIGYTAALRGGEIFLLEATSLFSLLDEGRYFRRPFVLIPLMGRFKNETGERNVLLPLVQSTSSGLHIRKWVDRLANILVKEGRHTGPPGPAFCKENGFVISYAEMNYSFHRELECVQQRRRDLIPSNVDVTDHWNIYRSLRRGATVRATELDFGETCIDMNNRWRKNQTVRRRPNLKMREIYLDIKCTINTHLSFSEQL